MRQLDHQKRKKVLFMKKFILGGTILFSMLSLSVVTNAELNNELNGYDFNIDSLAQEVNKDEFEVYDDQGNLIDNSDVKLIEYTPINLTRSTIYNKYVTTYFTYQTSAWPSSHYIRRSGGWQGTVHYKNYIKSQTLWGYSYQVNYGGTLYRWDI